MTSTKFNVILDIFRFKILSQNLLTQIFFIDMKNDLSLVIQQTEVFQTQELSATREATSCAATW
jgi:hypothetical protein